MAKLSEAQDAFFAAFAQLDACDRGMLLDCLEMAIDDHTQYTGSKAKANVALNALDALSQAISEEQ